MDRLTVLPFLVSMFIAVASMPTDVYQICAGGWGTEHTEPWRASRSSGLRHAVRTLMAALSTLWSRARSHPQALPAALAIVALLAVSTLPADAHVQLGIVATFTGASQLKALRQEAATINARALELNQKVAEKKALSDEERAEIKANRERMVDVKAALEIAEEANEAERTMARETAEAATQAANDADAQASATAREAASLPRVEFGKDLKVQAPGYFGRQLQAVRNFSAGSATKGDREILSSMMAAATGLNETVPSEGGFLVDQPTVGTIRQRMYEVGDLLKRVSKIPLSEGSNGIKLPAVDETSRADGSRHGGIRAYWTAEAGEKLASKPKFRIMDLTLHKVAALVYSTDELLQDAVALEAWIMRNLPDELTFKVEDAIVSGTGAGQPLGFLNGGGVISVARTTANRILWDDIVNMWSRMWAPSRKNAIWLVDQGAEAQLYSMSMAIGTGGVPVFMPAGGAANQPFSTLFGRPIITSEYGAALGTVGDLMLIDPTQYTLIDKGGIQNATSIHVRFVYDESVFRFVYRVDGEPDWVSALTPKSGGATTSPYVLLAT